MPRTGKASFLNNKAGLHDLRYAFGRCLRLLPLLLAAFLLLIPFSTAGLEGNSIFNLEVTHQQMKFRLFLPEVIPALIGAALLAGFLTGLSLFHFVLDKKEETIYFSLGIRRLRLFGNRLLAGLALLLVSIGIPMALSCLLNIRALGCYSGLVRNTLFLTACLFLCSACSLLVTALAAAVSGTAAEACLCWAALMGLTEAGCFSVNLLMKLLSPGWAGGRTAYAGDGLLLPTLTESLARYNPLRFLQSALESNGQFYRPLTSAVPDGIDLGLPLLWLGIVLLLGAAAALLLCRRPAEQAEITGGCPALTELAVFLSGFLAFAAVLSLLGKFSLLSGVILGLLAFGCVHLFWRRAGFSYRSRRKHLGSLLCQLALLGLVCIVSVTGFSLTTESFLKGDRAVSVEVTYAGAPSLQYGASSGSTTGRGYYLVSSVTLTGESAVAKVREIHRGIAASAALTAESGDSRMIPYDICFRYTDEDGKTMVRYYDRASFAQLEQLMLLEDETEIHEAQAEIFVSGSLGESRAADAYAGSGIYLSDSMMTAAWQLTLDEENRQDLLAALSADTSALSAEQRYFPEGTCKAVLLFSNAGEQDCRYYTYHLDNAYVYLTEAYAETLGWLEKNGLLELTDTRPQVESIVLQRFDPDIGMSKRSEPLGMYFMAYCADSSHDFLIMKDFGKQYVITDPEQTAQLAGLLQNGCSMTRGGFLAAVKLAGEERWRYLFLPQDSVPDFVRG